MADHTRHLYEQYLLSNYPNPPALFAERGKGTLLWDEEGREYLDFTSGIAVSSIGHGHPAWVKAVSSQAKSLAHCSNLFGNRNQALLAEKICTRAGAGKVFFCNSGAEANEALLKLARLYGQNRSEGEEGKQYRVICAGNAFHGRTFGGMAATPQEKIQGGFRPMLEGFSFAKLNDIRSFEKLVTKETAAVFIETIQGEGGIFPASTGFLQELESLCRERQILLMIDEVQCGIGRSGTFFAYEVAGIQPDAIGMAKGLGGGFPIGAIWVAEPHAGLFGPGSHGTTFGGNPLASAAALATLEVIEAEDLLAKVTRRSRAFTEQLAKLAVKHPHLISEIRGRGYMIGIALKVEATPLVTALRKEGLLTVPAGKHVLRLLPPLNVKKSELKRCIAILDTCLSVYRSPEAQG